MSGPEILGKNLLATSHHPSDYLVPPKHPTTSPSHHQLLPKLENQFCRAYCGHHLTNIHGYQLGILEHGESTSPLVHACQIHHDHAGAWCQIKISYRTSLSNDITQKQLEVHTWSDESSHGRLSYVEKYEPHAISQGLCSFG